MGNVIYMMEWKRTRLGGGKTPVRRVRPTSQVHRTKLGFVRIGDAAADVVKRLE